MTRPEDALEKAREAAREGGYVDEAPVYGASSGGIDYARLAEWAIIDPRRARVYSTRRLGAPITWGKRLLLRMLRQHHEEVTAQQTRFNAQVAAALATLDARVRALEEARGERTPGA